MINEIRLIGFVGGYSPGAGSGKVFQSQSKLLNKKRSAMNEIWNGSKTFLTFLTLLFLFNSKVLSFSGIPIKITTKYGVLMALEGRTNRFFSSKNLISRV
jgi:hypothetical protein